MSPNDNAITNSGDILGPFVSASKNLIIPKDELGLETPGPFLNLTMISPKKRTLI